jgi:hypothetical protein
VLGAGCWVMRGEARRGVALRVCGRGYSQRARRLERLERLEISDSPWMGDGDLTRAAQSDKERAVPHGRARERACVRACVQTCRRAGSRNPADGPLSTRLS